ncbi:MAG: hypothetical protein ACJAQU_000050 [Loktanella salsilacus]|jgi:hypothetical protein
MADTTTANEDTSVDAFEEPLAPDWLVAFKTGPFPEGTYHAGRGFSTVFSDRASDVLVVSFDNLSQVREDMVPRSPWGYSFVAKNGWSQLGVMSDNADWFRNDALFAHMRSLSEAGFFAKFRKVVMTGTSMGGYAACAFAGLAPGCTVLAFSPQSSLKKDLVPWETRYNSGRKADWTGDFADATETSHSAKAVYLIYDPLFEEDVRHIDRFTGDNVIRLKARYAGHKTALFLRRAGGLSDVVRTVVETEMTVATFYKIYRKGRNLPWYMHAVRNRITAGGRDRLLPAFAEAVRKMGFENIARSAGAAPQAPVTGSGDADSKGQAKGSADHTAPRPAAPAKAVSGMPRRNGPHEKRLAAMATGNVAPAAEAAQRQPKVPSKITSSVPLDLPADIAEAKGLDLFASAPNLPPLIDVGALPWQMAQHRRRKGLPGSE